MPLYDEMYNMVKKHNPASEAKMASICSGLINNHSHWEEERRVRRQRLDAMATTSIAEEKDSRRPHFDSFDIFIPIPKDRTTTGHTDNSSSSAYVTDLDGPESPPMLIPVIEDQPGSPFSELVISPINATLDGIGVTPSLQISGQQSGSSSEEDDDEDDDDGPPMLPFNQAFK
jgi:hypothetical protein